MTAGDLVEGCTHRTPHRHGTATAYATCRCQCDDCRAAATLQVKQWRLARERGRPTVIPAAPVRAHIERVLATISQRELQRRTGVAVTTIRRLLNGADTIERERALRLLAITPQATAVGVRRRACALIALGWPAKVLADRLAVDDNSLRNIIHGRGMGRIPGLPERIVALFDELQATPPPPDVVPPLMARRARRWAVRQHWAPPAAWDNIDDPTEQPKGVAWDERRAA